MPALSEIVAGGLGRSVKAGLGWWVTELRGMLPTGWVPPSRGARAKIRPLRGSVEIERIADGIGERFAAPAPLEALDEESWGELEALIYGSGAELVLSPPDTYRLTLDLPRAARTRLRSAVALQLSEHAPVDPALLSWAIDSVQRDGERVRVGVTMAHRRRVDATAKLFEARGIPAPPIVAEVDGRSVPLAAGFRGQAGIGWTPAVQRGLLILALLLAAPLLTLVGASVLTARNEQAISQLEMTLTPRLASDRRVRQAERLRRALSPLYAHAPASALLEDLARRLPDSAHAVEVGVQANGSIAMTIDAADPDVVRPRLLGDALLPNLREVAQTKTDAGALRVSYVAGR